MRAAEGTGSQALEARLADEEKGLLEGEYSVRGKEVRGSAEGKGSGGKEKRSISFDKKVCLRV